LYFPLIIRKYSYHGEEDKGGEVDPVRFPNGVDKWRKNFIGGGYLLEKPRLVIM